MLNWSQLKRLVTSPAFWSLNSLFLLVPLIAKYSFPVSLDIAALYLAAWLLLAVGTLYAVFVPDIMKFENFGDFVAKGGNAEYLSELYVDCKINVEDGSVKILLENKAHVQTPDYKAFTFLYRHFEKTQIRMRCFLTLILIAAMVLVLVVNIYRACLVFGNAANSANQLAVPTGGVMSEKHFLALQAGDDVNVKSEDGEGGVFVVVGTVLAPDDGGFLVVEKEDGSVVRVPKSRIIVIVGK